MLCGNRGFLWGCPIALVVYGAKLQGKEIVGRFENLPVEQRTFALGIKAAAVLLSDACVAGSPLSSLRGIIVVRTAIASKGNLVDNLQSE